MPLKISQTLNAIEETIVLNKEKDRLQTFRSICLMLFGFIVLLTSVILFKNDDTKYALILATLAASTITSIIPNIIRPVSYKSRISTLKIIKAELNNIPKEKDGELACEKLSEVIKTVQ